MGADVGVGLRGHLVGTREFAQINAEQAGHARGLIGALMHQPFEPVDGRIAAGHVILPCAVPGLTPRIKVCGGGCHLVVEQRFAFKRVLFFLRFGLTLNCEKPDQTKHQTNQRTDGGQQAQQQRGMAALHGFVAAGIGKENREMEKRGQRANEQERAGQGKDQGRPSDRVDQWRVAETQAAICI